MLYCGKYAILDNDVQCRVEIVNSQKARTYQRLKEDEQKSMFLLDAEQSSQSLAVSRHGATGDRISR